MKLIITPGDPSGPDDDGGPGIRATLQGRHVLDDEAGTVTQAGRVEFRGLEDMELDAVVEVDIDDEGQAYARSLTYLPRPNRPLTGLAIRGSSAPPMLRLALEILTFPAVKVADADEWVGYFDKSLVPARTMPVAPRRRYKKVTDAALEAFVADFKKGGYRRAKDRHELSYAAARKWKQYAVDREMLPKPDHSAGGRPTHHR